MNKDYNRQSNGRFGAGNDGGPGRTKREVELEYMRAYYGVVTPERFAKVADIVCTFAEAGNMQAAKIVFEYGPGKPVERYTIEENDDDKPIFLSLPGRGIDSGDSDAQDTEPPALQSGLTYGEVTGNESANNNQ